MRVPWRHARGSVQQKGGNLRFAVRMWRLTGGDIWEAKRRMDDEVSVVLAESSSELVITKVKIGLEGEDVDNRLRVILAV